MEEWCWYGGRCGIELNAAFIITSHLFYTLAFVLFFLHCIIYFTHLPLLCLLLLIYLCNQVCQDFNFAHLKILWIISYSYIYKNIVNSLTFTWVLQEADKQSTKVSCLPSTNGKCLTRKTSGRKRCCWWSFCFKIKFHPSMAPLVRSLFTSSINCIYIWVMYHHA